MSEISPDSLTIASPRRRGRPTVAEPLQPVTAWLPPAYLARLDALAHKHDVPVSRVLRRLLFEALETPTKPR